ncbi:MAG: PAS domain-containing protein [Myxococcales bacterium]|nr:PAS domain-containing protein [Myxococcales bacterium]
MDTAQGPSPIAVPPTHVVAIGASAGGLEAIESFFLNMPTDSGLGFVVIQHLSPDYKSLMVELLSKKTAMPVHRAEDGMLVLPNHVYLIPPKKNLTIFHGKLLLTEQGPHRGINLPIDVFLRSLAEDQAEKGVGIILSGTGSDGMRGIRTVKEYGGMVMVQDEETAKFDGMPRAAISTGLADFVLAPEKMPAQLLAFVKHPYVANTERTSVMLTDEESMAHLFATLREHCKVDFTFYKPSTVSRRIERRMTVHQIEEIGAYVAFLRSSPSEVMTLFRELLIGVTSFFRDPEAFDRLALNFLPELFAREGHGEIRFWVAGCSTGEEAYSLAMLAREYMESQGISHDVKIFATDIDRDALHFAAAGVYPDSIAADVSPRLLSKYFFKKHESFQIARTIREMVVFAPHNLIKDPPFTNISLVSCRNLLIYLQPVLQKRVLEYFNFSLAARGVLMLGTSETTGDTVDLWESLDAKWKLYRSKGRQLKLGEGTLHSSADISFRERRPRFSSSRKPLRLTEEERLLERFLETVSDDLLPLSVVVNAQQEVLHVVGHADGYFKLPSGRLVNDIGQLAVKDLSVPLTTGIQRVFRQRQELRLSNLRVRQNGEVRPVELRIKPMPEKKGQEPLVAVFIGVPKQLVVPGEPGKEVLSFDLSREAEIHLQELEQELQFTRENLQATIEELETSNEELQATNEELLASNEELQSTNEELQSTNEELFTVNAESQSKIIELTELHNDVDNLLASSQIGTLLLDENAEVRRFSPQIATIFHLLDSDVGRPIGHIAHYLLDLDFQATLGEVERTARPIEREVSTRDGRWHLMRMLPYKVGPKAFSGTVLTFVDITRIKQAEVSARDTEERYRRLFDELTTGFAIHEVILDEAGKASDYRYLDLNHSYARLTGLRREDILGKRVREVLPANEPQFLERYAHVASSGEPVEFETFDATLGKRFHVKAYCTEPGRFAVLVHEIENHAPRSGEG